MADRRDLRPSHPSLGETVATFARIGILSFGGPAGQIALMHQVLVEQKRWISETRFLHALNFCMLLPGPEAQQLATYCGWLLHGWRGGIAAGGLFVLPGFLVILALSATYALYGALPGVAAVFFGLKCAVLAIVVEALLRVGARALRGWPMAALAAMSFVAIFAFGAPFPAIVAAAGAIGFALQRLAPGLIAAGPDAPAPADGSGYLDLAPERVLPTASRAVGVVGTWLGIWFAPAAGLTAIFGADAIFTPIALFFSKMAVVTFGGAYAVLAYVAQEAVQDLGWLRPGEMLDGLALAETTPGPLILVLVYVGFLAAFRAPPPGLGALASGALGAGLTAWVTFAPCFLWIFLGAPYLERLRRKPGLSAALTAVSAAVVGVIGNLSVWFALHVLFTRVGQVSVGPVAMAWPDFASFDWRAGLLAVAAALALFRLKAGMVATLAGAAVGGLILRAFA